jgi:hypothetical protein
LLADVLSQLHDEIQIDLFVSLLLNILWTWGKKNRRCFYLVPLLCRMAFSLLLHHEGLFRTGPYEAEMRRRMMWTCFLLDKLQAAGLPELTSCDITLLNLRMPSDQLGEDGGQLCLIESLGTKNVIPDQPLGILAFSVHVGELRYLGFRCGKSAVKNLDQWWLNDSMMRRIETDLYAVIRRLPVNLQYSKHNLMSRSASSCERWFFAMAHLWAHQTFCDLYRLAIPGMNESSPEIILGLIPAEILSDVQSLCIRNAVSICNIISENLELIKSIETLGDIFPFIEQSSRLLLAYLQQSLSININLERSEVGRLLNANLSVLFQGTVKNLPQARIIFQYIVTVCNQLDLQEYIPILSEMDAAQTPKLQEHDSLVSRLPIFAARELTMPSNLRPAEVTFDNLSTLQSSEKDASHGSKVNDQNSFGPFDLSYEEYRELLSVFMIP